MTKIALTAAAILVATGTAFAGSDHYGSNNTDQPATFVDATITASISKSPVDAPVAQGADRIHFGR